MSSHEIRVGDAERDASLQVLGDHFAAGRLSREEYDERAEAVWTARTRGDLRPMFADLPGQLPDGLPVRSGVRRSWLGPMPLVPLVPVLVGLIVLSALTHFPFVVLGLLLWVLLRRRHRARGSWRAPRGSWA